MNTSVFLKVISGISKCCSLALSVVFPSSGIFGLVLGLHLSPCILPDVGETWTSLGALSFKNIGRHSAMTWADPLPTGEIAAAGATAGGGQDEIPALSVHLHTDSLTVDSLLSFSQHHRC